MPEDLREKRYVEVVTNTSADGEVTPLEIVWDDGRRFRIDRIVDRRLARSLKTGGTGVRFTVVIGGTTTHLWHERPRWFVQARNVVMPDW